MLSSPRLMIDSDEWNVKRRLLTEHYFETDLNEERLLWYTPCTSITGVQWTDTPSHRDRYGAGKNCRVLSRRRNSPIGKMRTCAAVGPLWGTGTSAHPVLRLG
ncbi:hypothetical protein AFLA_005924 [Aspergillus flavus NRRL3357]|nr:hypothetical protein AFLA_005924 [Aspergillus flavus NRRL3357]